MQWYFHFLHSIYIIMYDILEITGKKVQIRYKLKIVARYWIPYAKLFNIIKLFSKQN